MLTTEQNVLLKFSVLHLVVLDQNVLTNGFDSVQLLVVLGQLSEEDLAEGTSAEEHQQLKIFVFDNVLVLSEPNQNRSAHFVNVIFSNRCLGELTYLVFQVLEISQIVVGVET